VKDDNDISPQLNRTLQKQILRSAIKGITHLLRKEEIQLPKNHSHTSYNNDDDESANGTGGDNTLLRLESEREDREDVEIEEQEVTSEEGNKVWWEDSIQSSRTVTVKLGHTNEKSQKLPIHKWSSHIQLG